PFDCLEPTHEVVRPILDWLKLFREFGAFPDVRFDAGFIMPHGILFRRDGDELSDDMLGLYAELLTQRALFVQQDKRRRALDWRGEQLDEVVAPSSAHLGEITERAAQFIFRAPQDRLCRVDLYFGTSLRVNTCHLLVRLLDAGTGTELRSHTFSAAGFPNNDWFPWRFDPLLDSGSKQFTIVISSQDAAPGNAVTIYCDRHSNIAYRLYSLQPAPEEAWTFQMVGNAERLQERLGTKEAELQEARGDLNRKIAELNAKGVELRSKEEYLEQVLGILRAHESSAAHRLIAKFRLAK